MVYQGGFPDNGEIVNFTVEDEPKWVKVKLSDGSEIQIKMEIVAIMKNGNDPNTGLPIYMVQATNIIRLNNIPKELISKKPKEGDKGQSGLSRKFKNFFKPFLECSYCLPGFSGINSNQYEGVLTRLLCNNREFLNYPIIHKAFYPFSYSSFGDAQ